MGVLITITADVLIVALSLKPILEQSEEVREEARVSGKQLLDVSQELEDDGDRAKLVGFVYIIAQIMQIEELFENEIMKAFISIKGEHDVLFSSESFEDIRDVALFDQDHYLKWIAPFVENAGVRDIDKSLEELRVISKTVYG